MWLNLLRLTTSIAGRALITNQLLGSKYADVAQLAEQLICNQALPAIDVVNLIELSHIGISCFFISMTPTGIEPVLPP